MFFRISNKRKGKLKIPFETDKPNNSSLSLFKLAKIKDKPLNKTEFGDRRKEEVAILC